MNEKNPPTINYNHVLAINFNILVCSPHTHFQIVPLVNLIDKISIERDYFTLHFHPHILIRTPMHDILIILMIGIRWTSSGCEECLTYRFSKKSGITWKMLHVSRENILRFPPTHHLLLLPHRRSTLKNFYVNVILLSPPSGN